MKVVVDSSGFIIDLKKFSKVVDEKFETVFRKLVFLIFNNIVYLTPVDTGRARSNWNIGVNEVDSSTNEVGLDGNVVSEAQATATAKGNINSEECTLKINRKAKYYCSSQVMSGVI